MTLVLPPRPGEAPATGPPSAVTTGAGGPPAPPPPSRWARFVAKFRRALPWLTLAWGVTSALIMNRKPERAWLVAVAVGAGWLVLALAVLAERRFAAAEARLHHKVARFTATAAAQSLMQLTLFFVLPFYWLSAAPIAEHRIFLASVALLCLLTTWDPLFRAIFRFPYAALPLKGATSFLGLFAALPFLGFSHKLSLWAATAGAAAGIPLIAWATAEPERRRRSVRAGLILAALVPVAVYLGAAKWIPPAPLRIVEGGIGTGVDREARLLQGAGDEFPKGTERLHCFTAIQAPLGLHEQVFHVWTRDGVNLYTAKLDVGGNRTGAWRTWSNVRAGAPGRYVCDVVTSTGQTLGRLEAQVGG